MRGAHFKEIVEFASGKDDEYVRERVVKSPALSSQQRQILEQRGVLSPEEIHRLASKTKQAVIGETGHRPDCHSDTVPSDEARRFQSEKLVTLRVP